MSDTYDCITRRLLNRFPIFFLQKPYRFVVITLTLANELQCDVVDIISVINVVLKVTMAAISTKLGENTNMNGRNTNLRWLVGYGELEDRSRRRQHRLECRSRGNHER